MICTRCLCVVLLLLSDCTHSFRVKTQLTLELCAQERVAAPILSESSCMGDHGTQTEQKDG